MRFCEILNALDDNYIYKFNHSIKMIQNAENDDTNDEECIDNDTNDEECIDNDTNDEGYVNDNDSESGPQNIPVLNKKQYNDIANHISKEIKTK